MRSIPLRTIIVASTICCHSIAYSADQSNIAFEFRDQELGVAATIVLPGEEKDWKLKNPFQVPPKSLTTSPTPPIFVRAVFVSSDGNIAGIIRTMKNIAPFDAAYVFDTVAIEGDGLKRTGVQPFSKSKLGKAYLVEYLHPTLNRRIGTILLYNQDKAIQILLNVPNKRAYEKKYSYILSKAKVTLDRVSE